MSGSDGGPWMPTAQYVDWTPQDEHLGSKIDPDVLNQASQDLLMASQAEFDAVEGQLYQIISLCDIVSSSLRAAEKVDWYGEARKSFSTKVGHFPRQLDSIAANVQTALNALVTFSEVTFTQQSRYNTAVSDMDHYTTLYQSAVKPSQPYPTKHDGMTIIRKLQGELTDVWWQIDSCVKASLAAREECMAVFGTIVENVPSEGPISLLIGYVSDAVSDVGHAFGDTIPALLAFLRHDSAQNLERLTKDLAVDAGAIATVLTVGAAGAGLAGAEVDGSLVGAAAAAGDYAGGVSINATVVAAGDQFAQGEVGKGFVTAIFAAYGYKFEDDAESAVNQARALGNFQRYGWEKLDPADKKIIEELFPGTPEADLAAKADALNSELVAKLKGATTAAGVESLEDFLKDTFVKGPIQKGLGDG